MEEFTQSEDDILYFLDSYPSIKDKFLQYELFKKKEFNQLKLDTFDLGDIDGNFKHQLIIQRFLSGHTMYNGLLLIHGVGTGKTRTSILVSEINRMTHKKPPLIITKNNLLKDNFQEELIKYDSKFTPKNDRGVPIDPQVDNKSYKNKRSRLIKPYYEFKTLQNLAFTLKGGVRNVRTKRGMKEKKYPRTTDKDIIEKYSDRIIIIDESHNIRLQSGDEGEEEGDMSSSAIYEEIHRLTHLVKNSKILLMTATPIWDQSREIASQLNLILPLNEQLDYKHFDEKYFTENKKLKDDKALESLRKAMYGRVSYVRQSQSNVSKIYHGSPINESNINKGINIVRSEMSRFQYDAELKASQVESSSFFINERNAANFVFPNRTYRKEGFDKYISEKDKRYYFNDSIDKREIKENLSKYSQKYKDTIDQIISTPKQKEFVFFPYLKGSNAIVFGLILELYGYKRAYSPTNVLSKPEKRYIIVSGDTIDSTDMIRVFNDNKNVNGEYIQVIIGTRKMAEGVTLKNVLHVHIMMPHWHTAYIDQAIGRATRIGAFGNKNRVTVNIYLHASVYKDEETIDIKLYKLSEEKDYQSAQIYREAKRASFDCPLTYARNVNESDKSYTRDCDYQECNYECLQFPQEAIDKINKPLYRYMLLKGDTLDDSTYVQYYRSKEEYKVIQILRLLFKIKSNSTLDEIIKFVKSKDSKVSINVILYALEKVISQRIIFSDKFGILSTLNEIDNEYHLSETSRSIIPNSSNFIIKDYVSLSDIANSFRLDEEKYTLLKVCDTEDPNKIAKIIRKLSYISKVALLEGTYMSYLKKSPKAKLVMNELRNQNLDVIDIDNKNLIRKVFKTFQFDIEKKYRNLQMYIDKLKDFIITYIPLENVDNDLQSLKILVKNRKDVENLKNIKNLISELENKVLKSVKFSTTHVHILLGMEPEKTKYKRILHVTGLMRCYDQKNGIWNLCPHAREVEYVQYIKNKENVEKEIEISNPYGVYGTIDTRKDNVFRIVTKSGQGEVCTSIANKANLIDLILKLRDKEMQLEGKTTLRLLKKSIYQNLPKESLIQAINSHDFKEANKVKKSLASRIPLSDRTKEDLVDIEVIMNAILKSELCPLIQKWLAEKGLLSNR